MTNRQLIERWVELFNQKDAAGMASLYHEDAVNHQVVQEPVVGKRAIHHMFAQDFARAEMVCINENIFTDADWAILEWRDPLGLRGCGFFQIEAGRIRFQRGYWDRLSFLRQHGMPLPTT
ncbi:MAG TPA: nuclear transport factor 2 family protein [Cyclobacteriaceae bacterium]|nr:nuclear transport factor 2 family protein [Cyclobacteriaceae bacterium]